MKRLAIFASGNGGNFEAIVSATERGDLPARVALLVADRPDAFVVERARRHGVDAFVFTPRDYPSKEAYESEIVRRLEAARVDLVCLAGYMRLVGETLLDAYGGRIVNIHPSLLPAFKGAHAIADALACGVKVFGVTIHLVDATLDGGPILAQRAFPYEGSDLRELEAMVHAVEHPLYVETIRKMLESWTN